MVLLEGVLVTVNIALLCTVVLACIGIGAVIWRLAERIKGLEGKFDTLERHTEDRLKAVDTEIKHQYELINEKLKASDRSDQTIISTMNSISSDLKQMNTAVSKMETAMAVASAIAELTNSLRRKEG